jgi:hypothetical protein
MALRPLRGVAAQTTIVGRIRPNGTQPAPDAGSLPHQAPAADLLHFHAYAENMNRRTTIRTHPITNHMTSLLEPLEPEYLIKDSCQRAVPSSSLISRALVPSGFSELPSSTPMIDIFQLWTHLETTEAW